MTRFTKPTINWVVLEKLVPSNQKAQFIAFKGKSEAYLHRVLANPPEPPKIDWAAYQKIVPVKGLVEKFRKEYESFKVPFPTDTMTAKVDEQWVKLQEEIKAFNEEREKEKKEAEKELAKIKALPKFDDITMEMMRDMYPEDALDSVKKPSFWPHNPEEQLGYVAPELTDKTKK